MECICIENKHGNTNFTLGKTYQMNNIGLRTNWGGMWCHFKDYNKPFELKSGNIFEFGMCKFKVR